MVLLGLEFGPAPGARLHARRGGAARSFPRPRGQRGRAAGGSHAMAWPQHVRWVTARIPDPHMIICA